MPPAPPRQPPPRLPVGRDLETILLKALAKDPERRYQSVAALGEEPVDGGAHVLGLVPGPRRRRPREAHALELREARRARRKELVLARLDLGGSSGSNPGGRGG